VQSPSAHLVAEALTPESIALAELRVANWATEMGVEGLARTLAPRSAAQALASASSRGHQVTPMLDAMAMNLQIETNRKSLPSVSSGLRCWHMFCCERPGVSERPHPSPPQPCRRRLALYSDIRSRRHCCGLYRLRAMGVLRCKPPDRVV